jgi:hypothetical protein
MDFHVQWRQVLDMNQFFLPGLKFIFLSVSANFFDECFKHYVQDLLYLLARGFGVFRYVNFLRAQGFKYFANLVSVIVNLSHCVLIQAHQFTLFVENSLNFL